MFLVSSFSCPSSKITPYFLLFCPSSYIKIFFRLLNSLEYVLIYYVMLVFKLILYIAHWIVIVLFVK